MQLFESFLIFEKFVFCIFLLIEIGIEFLEKTKEVCILFLFAYILAVIVKIERNF